MNLLIFFCHQLLSPFVDGYCKGMDTRFPVFTECHNISIIVKKHDLLTYLTSKDISEFDKLKAIKQNNHLI